MKIATWNVNSLRVRLNHLVNWLQTNQPDIVALQEIKCLDEDFPAQELQAAGYQTICAGQRAYNGVAILSREPASNIMSAMPDHDDPQKRLLAVTISEIRIINLYIPNGQDISSEKFKYKMTWLEKLKLFLQQELKTHKHVVVLGDFNIAPQEIDVHDPKAWENKIHFTSPERQAFQDILNLGLVDCFRMLSSEPGFTWWDYRLNAYKRKLGLRIDHILATPLLAKFCLSCEVNSEMRSLERPSDHAPVVSKFSLNQ